MKIKDPANQKNSNNLFLTLVIRNIHYFILFLLLVYGMSAIVVKGSGMISTAIDKMLNGKQVDIEELVLWTLVLVAISMVLAFVKQICGELFSIKIQKACKNKTAEHLMDLEYSYFTGQTGAVINKLTSDIGDVGSLLSEVLPEVMQSAVAIITYCIAIYQMDFRLLLGILICYPVVLAISSFIAKKLVALAKKRRGKYDLLAEVTADSLSGIVVERAYGLYDILSEKTNGVVKDILKNEFVRNRYQSISTAIQTFVKWLPTVICAVIALFEVLSGRITVGTLMAFMVLFIKLSDPMSSLPFRINDGREFMVSLRRINEIMRTPAEPSGTFTGEPADGENVQSSNAGSRAVIELKDIGFCYKEAEDRKILRHLNTAFEEGKTTAVVGGSGAGKTTLFKLLCGFEQVTQGSYELFGVNFREWNLKAARKRIALVSQNVFLFPDTIAANVAYGSESATLEEIQQACKMANIHEYIMTLPEQYETIVGERGANLSGGEKQRISMARAFLKKAPILLMDEPTSALDTKTEAAIQRALEGIAQNTTVIMIAHRLSTIQNADHILVLDQGTLAESGTHQELLKQDGVYASLYKRERHTEDLAVEC